MALHLASADGEYESFMQFMEIGIIHKMIMGYGQQWSLFLQNPPPTEGSNLVERQIML